MTFGESMQTLFAIARREFALYFKTPFFYLLGGFFLLATNFFFMMNILTLNTQGGTPSMQQSQGLTAFIMALLFAPLFSMRLISEEARQGTLEVLLTKAVRDWHIVVGKFLAVWGVVTVMLLITSVQAFILVWRGDPDQRIIMTGYLGLWLFSGGALALGTFMSSLTKYQFVAGVLAFVTNIILWVIAAASSLLDLFANSATGSFVTTARDVFSNLSLTAHYNSSMLNGLIRVTDIAYYVFLIALSLFLATRVLETRRWRS